MKLDLVASLKEFFFDIIGFLIPGIIVLSITKYVIDIPMKLNLELFETLILAYVIGYVIFSFSLLKDKLFDKFPECWGINSVKKILSTLSNRDNFQLASELINNKIKEGDKKLVSYKSFRNYAMSVTPESDQKVFTFMFRAELFNQLHTISLLTFVLGSIILALSLWTDISVGLNFNFYWLGLFLILSLVLRNGWERFYMISMNIPFSLYLAKIKNSENGV